MAKIHPLTPVEPSASSSTSYTKSTETFTVWMKSLVMQANGCTVYNENGEIVYRVDNYDKKGCNSVYLMDLTGKVLFTVLKRKQWLSKQWRGYKSDGLNQSSFFECGRKFGIFGGGKSCQITVPCGFAQDCCYKLEVLAGKSAFKITNSNGGLVAEAKRKQSSSGVQLGDDVLTLKVESNVDHSFIMALVIVYGLMHCRL